MTNAHSPLVSILTPSFNQESWLRENLESVACQTYDRIEQIVMDGGSTDGSVDILRAAGDSVIWRSEPDRGQSDAINKAFSLSTGEIIGWLNSDDAYFDCTVVADVVEFFDEHPDIDVVYGHALKTTEDGRAIVVLWVPPFDADLLRTVDVIIQPAAFIRRSALSEPMLDESFHFTMDYELWLRLMTHGSRFARLDRILAVDRHQLARKSATIKDTWAADQGRLAEMYETRLGPQWERDRTRYYVRQRLFGARLIPSIKPPLAFKAPADMRAGLLARQIWKRRSAWPPEFR